MNMIGGILNIAKNVLGGISGGNEQQQGSNLPNTPLLQFAPNTRPGGEFMKSFLA